MITKRLLSLTALFFMGIASYLPAQSGHYVIEQRYVQQLAWVGDEYTSKYELVIERNEGKGYRAYMREFTESPSLQISVPPGNYRYRIIPYDFLDQPGEPSNWVPINIQPAPVRSAKDDGIALEKQESPESKNKINLYVSAAWEPVVPLSGELQQIYGYGLFFTGATLRFGFSFNKPEWFDPGLELSSSWYSLNRNSIDTIALTAGATGLNITAQKRLPNQRMAVTLRAGGGFSFQIVEVGSEPDAYSFGGLVPHVNLEASFLWLALKQLYLEAGLGYVLILNKNNFSGCLRPCVGVGWRF